MKSSVIVLERLTADAVIFELPILNGATVTDINTDAANEPGVNSIPVPVSADATTDAVCVVLTTVVPWKVGRPVDVGVDAGGGVVVSGSSAGLGV